MASLSIHILGGTRTQTPERQYADEHFDSCLVVETDESLYLLDCGNPASALLADQFADSRQKPIRGIFISHADPDHICGLWSLVAAENYNRKSDFVVALPLPGSELPRCQEFLKLAIAPLPVKSKIRFVAMPLGYTFEENGFRLDTLPNEHLNPLRAVPNLTARPFVDYQPSFSFRLKYHGLTVIYSADYRWPGEIEPWLQEGAHLAILENAHTPPMEVYAQALAAYANLPFIVLTHFWHLRGKPDDLVDIARRQMPHSRIIAATAGMEFRFDLDHKEAMPQVIPFAERIKGRHARRYPTPAEIESFCRQRGMPLEWSVIGPFDNPRRGDNYIGLDQDHGIGPRPDFERTFKGKEGRAIRWQHIPLREIRADGSVPLDGEECLAYVYSRFSVPADGKYDILAGSDDGCRMWVDGKELFYINESKGAVADEYRIPIDLQAGEHEVLMAVDQKFGSGMYFWRIVAAQ
jgi:ribonuclease BN (tRNA processing enzyme)